jgi:hypothetical protein
VPFERFQAALSTFKDGKADPTTKGPASGKQQEEEDGSDYDDGEYGKEDIENVIA